jgi:hypothetical protein
LFRSITKRLPKAPDDHVQTVIGLDGSAITPELLLEFFATDQLAWLLQQSGQDPARLLAEPDARTVPEELAGLRIQLKWVKR